MRGSYATCKKFEEKLGVKEGQVSEDGKFSIEFMECLADCGEGPVVMVGEQTFENIEKRCWQNSRSVAQKKLDESKEFVSYEKAVDSVRHPQNHNPIMISKKTPKERRIILKHADNPRTLTKFRAI